MEKSRRNGKIELARFVFAVIIMLFHIGDDALTLGWKSGIFTFFRNGSFGVEFFFAVSGFLMAASAFKSRDKKLPLGKDTACFLSKKLMAILPLHLIVFTVKFIFDFAVRYKSAEQSVKFILGVIPNFLLIQRSGLYTVDVLGVEWYISNMLFAMLLLYPLCKKYYESFTRIIAPITALLILGYLTKTFGGLSGSAVWSVLVSKTLLRAIAEICAGAFAFEICRNIKKLSFSVSQKVFLTVFEAISYFVIFVYIILGISQKYGATIFLFACVAVVLSFSDLTYGKRIFNNKFCCFLGSLSLPIYLCHSFTRKLSKFYFADFNPYVRIVIFVLMTVAFVAICIPLEKLLRKSINNTIEKLKPKA